MSQAAATSTPLTRLEREPVSKWLPIEMAPKDGTVIIAYLYQTGIRYLRWMSPAECASYEGFPQDVEDYDGTWVESHDDSSDWSPRWWLPADALPEPPQ